MGEQTDLLQVERDWYKVAGTQNSRFDPAMIITAKSGADVLIYWPMSCYGFRDDDADDDAEDDDDDDDDRLNALSSRLF